MRRVLLAIAFIGASSIAPAAFAGDFEIRLGAFIPRADTGAHNDLFVDDSVLYNVTKSDWHGFSGGVQYNVKIVPNVQIGFGIDGYGETVDTSYRDYVGPTGREIRQTLKIDMVPMSVELRLTPTSRRVKIAPFVGVGGDLIYWKYEEFGDFIDFDVPSKPIVPDSFISEGWNPAFHVSGGIRFAVTDDIGITAQARYQWGSANMGRDFSGLKLDLSGATYTGGVNIRF